MANFFSNIINQVKGAVSSFGQGSILDEERKKKKGQKPMEFSVTNAAAPVSVNGQRVEIPFTPNPTSISTPSGQNALGVSNDNFFKHIVESSITGTYQYPARAAASVISTKEFQPRTPAERAVFGDEPVKPIAQRMAEKELDYKDTGWGKLSLPLAVGSIGTSTLLDLLPGNPLEKPSELVSDAQKKARVLFVDRYAPVYDFTDAARKSGKITAATDPYIHMRLFAGQYGKVQNRLDVLSDIISPVRKDLPDIEKLAKYERFDELANRGITEFENGMSIEQIRAERDQLLQKLGPEKAIQVARLHQYNQDLIKYYYEGGMISSQTYENILANNEKYVPLHRAEYVAEQLDNIPAGGSGFNVSSQTIVQTIKGSEKTIRSPLESMVDNTYRIVNTVEKNKVAQKIGDLSQIDDFKDTVIPLVTADQVTTRIEKATELRELAKTNRENVRSLETTTRQMKKLDSRISDISEEMESLADQAATRAAEFDTKGNIVPLIEKAASRERRIYRLRATAETNQQAARELEMLIDQQKAEMRELRSSLKELRTKEVPAGFDKISAFRNGIKEEYAVPKEIADVLKNQTVEATDFITRFASMQSRLLRAGSTTLNLAFIPTNAIRDFVTATIVSKVGFTPADWIRGFAEAWRKGDDYKSFLETGASMSGFFERNKSLATTVKQLSQSKTLKNIKSVVNPLEAIRLLGEKIELAPRIGVYKRAMRKGKLFDEAAYAAREATVDFAKAGSAMKVLSQWIPFLNARTQGAVNIYNAIQERPVRAAVLMSGLVGVPTVAAYIHNTKNHPDIWKDIAQFEKDNNILIIYGDERDEDGNPTEVIKIPKSDVGKVFGNPLEEFLTFLDGNDPKQIDNIAVQMFSDVSPINFAKEGEFSLDAMASGVLPPGARVVAETASNHNFYTGREIVPQSLQGVSPELQYKQNTPKSLIIAGQFLKVSPLHLENIVRGVAGGLGSQVVDPLNAGGQVSRRFKGAYGGQEEQALFKDLATVEQQYEDKRITNKRTAQALYDELKSLPAQERQKKAQQYAAEGKLSKDVLEQLEFVIVEQVKGLDSFEKVLVSKPAEVRARLIKQKLDTLPVEDRQQLFRTWAEKKIITERVMEELAQLLTDK